MIKTTFLLSLIICISSCSSQSHDGTKLTAKDLDMNNIIDASDKKKRFFDFMRPIVNSENKKVLALRETLLNAKKNNNKKGFVAHIAKEYTVPWKAGEENWDKLLERVDAVALEIVLAQSANETAWGQSRFAQKGNNFFGQWCYKKGCGIVPAKRDKNATHEVAKFNSVNESVRSYLKNINTSRAYYPLRKIRRENSAAGKKPDGYAQAAGLIKYSQRREEYVKEIRSMIHRNKELILGENKSITPST